MFLPNKENVFVYRPQIDLTVVDVDVHKSRDLVQKVRPLLGGSLVQLSQVFNCEKLLHRESVHNKSLNKVLSVHQQSLEHEFREEILFHFKGPVTEYSLLGDIQPVPDQGEVQLGVDVQVVSPERKKK